MKKLLIIASILLMAGFVYGDASDLGNALHAFGNCEGGPIFVQPGRDGTTTLAGQSEDPSGAVGKCLKIKNDMEARIEGSTTNESVTYAGLSGTDVGISFYLKGGAGDKIYSYPRFAIRKDPIGTGGYEEVTNAAAYKEWTNTSWTFDDSWRQYSFTLTTITVIMLLTTSCKIIICIFIRDKIFNPTCSTCKAIRIYKMNCVIFHIRVKINTSL